MASTRTTAGGILFSSIRTVIGRPTMRQIATLNRRVLHRALVMLERSAAKLARSVLRGERSREAHDLPGESRFWPDNENRERESDRTDRNQKSFRPREAGGRALTARTLTKDPLEGVK